MKFQKKKNDNSIYKNSIGKTLKSLSNKFNSTYLKVE